MQNGVLQMAFSWLTKPTIKPPKREATKRKAPKKKARNEIDQALTEWCRETATRLGLPELARCVEVTWNPAMRTTAGRAWWPQRLIELNPKIDEIDPQHSSRTLRHELAHLIAYERAGRKKIAPHGIEWRKACAELGIAGESVYHHLPLPGRKQTIRFLYFCPQCQTETKRVRKIKRALACYACCKHHSGGQYDARFRLVEKRSA